MTSVGPDSNEPEVLYDVDGHIATITLNRPHRRNAISVRMLLELGDAIERVERDRGVRVAILTGAGAGFCSGLDIKDAMAGTGIGGGGSVNPGGSSADFGRTTDLPTVALHEMNTPIIAALNGAAAGYGLDLALGCDLRLAARSARILPGFAKRAIVPRVAAPGISLGSSAGRKPRRSPTSVATSPRIRPRSTASSTRSCPTRI